MNNFFTNSKQQIIVVREVAFEKNVPMTIAIYENGEKTIQDFVPIGVNGTIDCNAKVINWQDVLSL